MFENFRLKDIGPFRVVENFSKGHSDTSNLFVRHKPFGVGVFFGLKSHLFTISLTEIDNYLHTPEMY